MQAVARKPRGYWQRGTTIRDALSKRKRDGLELSVTALLSENAESRRLLDAISRRYKENGKTRGAFMRALLDASIDPAQAGRPCGKKIRWTREKFAHDLQEAAGEEKLITPAKLKAIREAQPNWYRMLFYRFSSIEEACKYAGVIYTRSKPFNTGIKWDRDIAAEKLSSLHTTNSIPSVEWLKLNHCDLYSAIQYHFRDDARALGLSRFHAACLHAGINYYAISTTIRSPK